jgi:hypothetical protein
MNPNVTAHVRKPMPRKRGNSFYRDTNDYSKFAVTLCGAPVTEYDVDFATAGTKTFRVWVAKNTGEQPVCATCLTQRQAMIVKV